MPNSVTRQRVYQKNRPPAMDWIRNRVNKTKSVLAGLRSFRIACK